jgi:hypothetical protein
MNTKNQHGEKSFKNINKSSSNELKNVWPPIYSFAREERCRRLTLRTCEATSCRARWLGPSPNIPDPDSTILPGDWCPKTGAESVDRARLARTTDTSFLRRNISDRPATSETDLSFLERRYGCLRSLASSVLRVECRFRRNRTSCREGRTGSRCRQSRGPFKSH